MLERCSSLEGGLSERAKFGFGFALVVALAMTAWIVLTGDPKVDSESRQLAEQGDPRSPSLAAVGEELGQDEGSEAEATRSSVRSLRARSFPARRDELDPFARRLFRSRVAVSRMVARSTVRPCTTKAKLAQPTSTAAFPSRVMATPCGSSSKPRVSASSSRLLPRQE